MGTVSESNGIVTVTGTTARTAAVTVTATDGADASGQLVAQTFEVTVVPDAVNQPPVAARQLPAVSLYTGQMHTVDLGGTFDDPEGDPLTYVAPSTSRSDVATVSGIASGTFTVTAVAPGTATVTVGATDGHDGAGRPAVQTFDVTVESPPANLPPEVGRALENLDLDIGATARVSLAGAFNDPEGDALTYAVTTSRADVATVSKVGSGSETFTVRGAAAGGSIITVTANDDTSRPQRAAVQTFEVTVALAAPPAPEGLRAELEGHSAAAVSWTLLPAWWSVTAYELSVEGPNGVELPFDSPLTGLAAPPVTLEPLQPRRYSIQVRAVNAVGDGPWSAPVPVEVPVPPLLTVGLGDIEPVYAPDQCSSFTPYSRALGRLDVELSRPARSAVTGILESASLGQPADPNGYPWLDIRGGRCPGVGSAYFSIPEGQLAVSLTSAFSCAVVPEQLVSVAFSDRLPPRKAGVRPTELLTITPGKSRVEVKVAVPVPALPAVGVLFLALLLGAVAWVRGRAGAQRRRSTSCRPRSARSCSCGISRTAPERRGRGAAAHLEAERGPAPAPRPPPATPPPTGPTLTPQNATTARSDIRGIWTMPQSRCARTIRSSARRALTAPATRTSIPTPGCMTNALNFSSSYSGYCTHGCSSTPSPYPPQRRFSSSAS